MNVRQSWTNLYSESLNLTFQFLNVLLKSITDPFIFSKVIDVEKMEIQQVNNWIIGKESIYIETNYSDPDKKHNFLKGFWWRFVCVLCTFFITWCIRYIRSQNFTILTRNKSNTSNKTNSSILWRQIESIHAKNHQLFCII